MYACEGGRDGRVVDGGGLENHCTRKGTGGSNPSPSANHSVKSSLQQLERGRSESTFFAIVRFVRVIFTLALSPPSSAAQRSFLSVASSRTRRVDRRQLCGFRL